jgi:OOP family OmpA-OmpF porin
MKRSLYYGVGLLFLAGPLRAQSLAGSWQGVEAETGDPRYYPAVLRLQGKDKLLGVLYQEVGGEPETTITFQMQGTRTATGLRLVHGRRLNETQRSFNAQWATAIRANLLFTASS